MRTSVDVRNYLLERDIPHELFAVRGRLRTPERLAAVLELPAEQVGKVVVFETDKGPLAVLVPSDATPEPERVRKTIRAKEASPAEPRRASELSDFIPDAIPPVGLPREFRVVMDRSLAGEDVVYFHGGDPTAVLKLRGKDLARAAEAKVVDLS